MVIDANIYISASKTLQMDKKLEATVNNHIAPKAPISKNINL